VTSARVHMFLVERDRALARGDHGVVRATTADLRRLGVPDWATVADPTGKNARRANGAASKPQEARKKPGPKPKPRCEHGVIAERCAECNEELLVAS
jgi:hypothetical protein